MWELIQSNKRKSVGLIVLLSVLLMSLGWAIGFIWAPDGGGTFGVFIAVIVWAVMMGTAFGGGEKVLLATAGAREVQPKDAPQLHNIVEEMQIASGLPVKPRVYIINNPTPNAFAVGLKPERAAVAVTTGLMARLNRDELQGVIAHELGHINNRDTMFMTLAGVTVGAIIIVADLFIRGMWFSSGRRRSSRNEGPAMLIMLVVSIVLAILAPLLAQMLYFACSRRREYLADASAAQYTRYPEGLASALEKISGMQKSGGKKEVSRALAPMYIVNPLAAHSKSAGLFSTHPSTADRIKVLRGMANDASLIGYERAYAAIHKRGIVGNRTLGQATEQAPRQASTEPKSTKKKSWRDAQDALHNADRYFMLACVCGLKLKIPPDFKGSRVTCPKCGKKHELPPELFAAAAGMDAAKYAR